MLLLLLFLGLAGAKANAGIKIPKILRLKKVAALILSDYVATGDYKK